MCDGPNSIYENIFNSLILTNTLWKPCPLLHCTLVVFWHMLKKCFKKWQCSINVNGEYFVFTKTFRLKMFSEISKEGLISDEDLRLAAILS